MMRLEAYQPVSNDILLEIRQTHKTPKGIILPNPQQDRVMRVLKVGNLVDHIKPGDWVLVGPMGQGIDMPFTDNNGNKIFTVQTSVHSVIGTYQKDEKTEDKVFMSGDDTNPQDYEERPGPSNIIDNPGIEHAPFLKENDLLN